MQYSGLDAAALDAVEKFMQRRLLREWKRVGKTTVKASDKVASTSTICVATVQGVRKGYCCIRLTTTATFAKPWHVFDFHEVVEISGAEHKGHVTVVKEGIVDIPIETAAKEAKALQALQVLAKLTQEDSPRKADKTICQWVEAWETGNKYMTFT